LLDHHHTTGSRCWQAERDLRTGDLSPWPGRDRVYQAQSLHPQTILGHDHLYKSVLHFENPVCPPWFFEAVAVYTSVLNNCPYAVEHHFANLKYLLEQPERAADILSAFQNDTLAPAFTGRS